MTQTTTQVRILLDSNGMEQLAKGEMVYPWQIHAQMAQDPWTHEERKIDEGMTLLMTVPVPLPSRDAAINHAAAALQSELNRKQAEFTAYETAMRARIQNILALTWEQPA